MDMVVSREFRELCEEIRKEGKSQEEWAVLESDDMFQSASFSGGYDGDENAFCFSYYDEGGQEFWFQLTPDEVAEVAAGTHGRLELRPAE